MKKNMSIALVFFFIACGVVEQLANRNPVIKRVAAENQNVMIGDTVRVWVEASDPDEDELTFAWTSAGGLFLDAGEDTVRWMAPNKEDEYEISVTVQDENRGKAEGSMKILVVSPSEPKVLITQPQNNEVLVGLGVLEIKATASPERFIDRIEFYIDTILLGTDLEPPFSYLWNLDRLYGLKKVKAIAIRRLPENIQSADSVFVTIEGVIPIPY